LLFLHEVSKTTIDTIGEVLCGVELAGGSLILARKFDVGRSRRTRLEQLDLKVPDPPTDFEDRPARQIAPLEIAEQPCRHPVEALAAITPEPAFRFFAVEYASIGSGITAVGHAGKTKQVKRERDRRRSLSRWPL